jgi:hypothetical protein
MRNDMPRREFLQTMPMAALALSHGVSGATAQGSVTGGAIVLESFDYRGVRLGESPWKAQYQATRDYVLDTFAHSENFRLPDTDAELNRWLVADTPTGAFHVEFPGGGRVGSKLLPFYTLGEVAPYKMYFDKKALPFRIW